jgi:hypothetical protein
MHGGTSNVGCTPALLYILGLLPLGWLLQSFPHVLNVIREALLGLPRSYTLYHTSANSSDVTSACILLRFARLQVSHTGSPSVYPRIRGTIEATFAMESEESGSLDLYGTLGKF